MFSNIIGGFIRLYFNCDSDDPAVGTGYTSNHITTWRICSVHEEIVWYKRNLVHLLIEYIYTIITDETVMRKYLKWLVNHLTWRWHIPYLVSENRPIKANNSWWRWKYLPFHIFSPVSWRRERSLPPCDTWRSCRWAAEEIVLWRSTACTVHSVLCS